VKPRLQPWQFVILVVLAAAAAIGYMQWRRAERLSGAAGLLQCLPSDRATHLYIDVAMLRSSGYLELLAGSKTAEEADYRKFVEQTGFDYRTDLDAIAAAFVQGDVYLALRGRFNWPLLTGYAGTQGGRCENTVCSMPASQPGRNISFYPLHSDVLAMGVASEPRGVMMVTPAQWETPPQVPPVAVWASAPPSFFDDLDSAPAGSRSFLSPLARTLRATFSLGPSPDQREALEVRLQAECTSPQAAADLARQFEETTNLLRKMIERDHLNANPNDLSGVLLGGRFEPQQARLVGRWTVTQSFLQGLLSGTLQ
jgi:hypothetical protein